MEQDYDYLFKVVVVGASGVGKTSLLMSYVDKRFPEVHSSTIGVEFKCHTVNVDINGVVKVVRLQIWDTAGQERFRAVANSYFRGAHGAIFVFDVTDTKSLEDLAHWIDTVERFNVSVAILIGNKSDLIKDRGRVSEEAVAAVCESHPNMVYIETSAKTQDKVDEAFETIAHQMTELAVSHKLLQGEDPSFKNGSLTPGRSFRIGEDNEMTQRSGCCGGTRTEKTENL